MATINLYTNKGKEKTGLKLPNTFSGEINLPLLSQALYVYRARAHTGVNKTKTRGEMDMTKKKVWRQKGTGRARHGARSAPIFIGGGKAHGPKGVKKILTLPKKMRSQALLSALLAKLEKNSLVAAKNISSVKKTKDAQKLIDAVMSDNAGQKRATLVVADKNKDFRKKFNNISNLDIYLYTTMNAYRVHNGGLIILDVDIFEAPKTKKETKTKKS